MATPKMKSLGALSVYLKKHKKTSKNPFAKKEDGKNSKKHENMESAKMRSMEKKKGY